MGNRIDTVDYHPAYHELMDRSMTSGVHSLAWTEDRPGAHTARAALSYLWNQAENGIACPNTMSFAVVSAAAQRPRHSDAIGADLLGLASADVYDQQEAKPLTRTSILSQARAAPGSSPHALASRSVVRARRWPLP